MAIEQFSNSAQTTLGATITSGATTLTVAAAGAFPPAGNFRILVESELMLVTAVSGTTFTVTRGAEGTAAAAHSGGVTVTHVVTKGSLLQTFGDHDVRGAWANLPAAGLNGRAFHSTNGPYHSHDDGSTWATFAPLYGVTPPTPGDWTWVNQGLSTLTTTNGTMTVVVPKEGAVNIRGQQKTLPAAPYTITMAFQVLVPVANTATVTIAGLYDGTGFITLDLYCDQMSNTTPSVFLLLDKWTNTTTFSAGYNFLHGGPKLSTQGLIWGALIWTRIVDDNTQRRWQISNDGVAWVELANQSRIDFITPTKVFWGCNPNNNNIWPMTISLVSYSES